MRAAIEALGLFRELIELATAQSAALGAGDWTRFEALMDERDRPIGRLDALGAGGDVFAAAAPALRTAAREALAALAAVDAGNQARLAAERQALLAELPALDAHRRAAAAYRQAPQPPAYVDQAS